MQTIIFNNNRKISMNVNQHIYNFEVKSLIETQKIASTLANQIQIGNIIVLCGDLGAGKTEFVKFICEEMGVAEAVTSPSFTLINQYKCKYANIFHIDLYRIAKRNELLEIGFYELFDSLDSLFFIEWPENAFNMLPFIDYKISIVYTAASKRSIEITHYTKTESYT